MINVLEVKPYEFIVGGIEKYIAETIEIISQANDITIDLFTSSLSEENKYSKILKKSCRHFFIGSSYNPGEENIIILYKQLNRILKANHYDVIHIHGFTLHSLAVCAFCAKIHGISKIIVHSHSSSGPMSLKHAVARMPLKLSLSFCATDFFACSETAGKWMFSKRSAKKLIIQKNGINLNDFKIDYSKRSEYRQKLGYKECDKVIGHVGRFNDRKNQIFTIKIFDEIIKNDKRFKLLLIGDGELKELIESKVAEANLSDYVVFTGNVSNTHDYMQAMDLFVLPSLYEGLPLTGVEAQASGLPCIFSSSITKETKITDNVEFIPLDNMNKWIEVIEQMSLLTKSNNSEQIREAGYDIVSTSEKLKKTYME